MAPFYWLYCLSRIGEDRFNNLKRPAPFTIRIAELHLYLKRMNRNLWMSRHRLKLSLNLYLILLNPKC